MIYGPDDKPIVPEFAKALKGVTESWYKKSVLKMLESKMRFTAWWGPRLYDAMGSQIEWPNRPRIPVQVGKPMRFYRKVEDEAAEALGYRTG